MLVESLGPSKKQPSALHCTPNQVRGSWKRNKVGVYCVVSSLSVQFYRLHTVYPDHSWNADNSSAFYCTLTLNRTFMSSFHFVWLKPIINTLLSFYNWIKCALHCVWGSADRLHTATLLLYTQFSQRTDVLLWPNNGWTKMNRYNCIENNTWILRSIKINMNVLGFNFKVRNAP